MAITVTISTRTPLVRALLEESVNRPALIEEKSKHS